MQCIVRTMVLLSISFPLEIFKAFGRTMPTLSILLFSNFCFKHMFES